MNKMIIYPLITSFFAVAFICSLHNSMRKFTVMEVVFSLILSILIFSGFITYLFKTYKEVLKRTGTKW